MHVHAASDVDFHWPPCRIYICIDYSIIVIADQEENTLELNICIQILEVYPPYEHIIERWHHVGFNELSEMHGMSGHSNSSRS